MTLQVHSSSRRPFFPKQALLQPGSAATPALGQIFARQRAEEFTNWINQEMKRPGSFQECSDVLGVVCSFLPYDDLKTMEGMSCKWLRGSLHGQALRLREYVQQHGFGANKWERYFGQVERIPLPLELLDILHSRCPFTRARVIVGVTHHLFLLPQTVDGKPLTLNNLEELVKNPKKDSGGNPSRYRYFSPEVKKQYGNQKTGASCWALKTRNPIPGSKNKSFEEQRKLIPLTQGYEIPEALTAAVGVFLRYVATGERLLPDAPWTYTRCQEQISECDRVYRVFVGSFGASGLVVNCNFYGDDECTGVAVLRKFSGT